MTQPHTSGRKGKYKIRMRPRLCQTGTTTANAAVFCLPAIEARFPTTTNTFVLSDSANAVVTNGSLDLAFGENPGAVGHCQAWYAVDPIYAKAAAGDAADLPFALFGALTESDPETGVGQTTAAFDAIQSLARLRLRPTRHEAAPIDQGEVVRLLI